MEKLKAEEKRLADTQKKSTAAIAALEATEAKRTETDSAVQAAKDEEKAIRAGMPGLNAEAAAAQRGIRSEDSAKCSYAAGFSKAPEAGALHPTAPEVHCTAQDTGHNRTAPGF